MEQNQNKFVFKDTGTLFYSDFKPIGPSIF